LRSNVAFETDMRASSIIDEKYSSVRFKSAARLGDKEDSKSLVITLESFRSSSSAARSNLATGIDGTSGCSRVLSLSKNLYSFVISFGKLRPDDASIQIRIISS
jgi:hypothetical protein